MLEETVNLKITQCSPNWNHPMWKVKSKSYGIEAEDVDTIRCDECDYPEQDICDSSIWIPFSRKWLWNDHLSLLGFNATQENGL